MADEAAMRANTDRFMREVFNEHNLDTVRELLTEDFVEHQIPPGMDDSREGAVKVFEMMFQAWPDVTCEVHDVVVSGDRVGIRSTFRGTHLGDMAFPGMPPAPATGKSFEIGALDIIRANDEGVATEHWGILDIMGLMTQLGLMPPPS